MSVALERDTVCERVCTRSGLLTSRVGTCGNFSSKGCYFVHCLPTLPYRRLDCHTGLSHEMASNSNERSRKRKRSVSLQGPSDEEPPPKIQHNDLICPICFEIWDECYVTLCGHSFCFKCITQTLAQSPQCPVCKSGLPLQNPIHPNFSLNDVVAKYRMQARAERSVEQVPPQVEEVIRLTEQVSDQDFPQLFVAMQRRMQRHEQEEEYIDNVVLLDFLTEGRRRKKKELEEVQKQLATIDKDITIIEKKLLPLENAEKNALPFADPPSSPSSSPSLSSSSTSVAQEQQAIVPTVSPPPEDQPSTSATTKTASTQADSPSVTTSKTSETSKKPRGEEKLASRKVRVHSNFEELLDDYFTTKIPAHTDEAAPEETDQLQEFAGGLKNFTKFCAFREVSSLSYGDQVGGCNIVSSIEFDKDAEYFAVAGVTKKIKVFDYYNVINNTGFHNHFPVQEMVCSAKLSSVCYNPYHKSTLASSDYDGCVCVWDTGSGKRVVTHQEHNKRVWSVVYNVCEPNLFASGSDDCTVKLWCANRPHSIFSMGTKANVCCVRFRPANQYHMAYGSADHAIHYVDLRNTKEPLHLLKGHRKAVSYVQFISPNEIVSASTDSELKLWNVESGQCVRTYKGHVNEKNFVGLTVNRNFIACGSENNSLYVFSKQVSDPMLSYKFNVSRSILPDPGNSGAATDSQQPDLAEFVSSVCWRKNTRTILAANSQGHIKVLEMTS